MASEADAQAIAEVLEELGISMDDVYSEASSEISSALDSKAEEVESAWRNLSPDDTGEYDSQLKIIEMEDDDGRPVRRVGDYARYAHIVEYGSEDTPERMVRARIAQQFGNEGKYLI